MDIWPKPLRCGASLPLILALSLTNCAGVKRSEAVGYCPQIVNYPPAFTRQLGDEMQTVREGTALATVVKDYKVLRDEIRAVCGNP